MLILFGRKSLERRVMDRVDEMLEWPIDVFNREARSKKTKLLDTLAIECILSELKHLKFLRIRSNKK